MDESYVIQGQGHLDVNLYKQYVRPHLEYAVQAWCPWLQHYINLLEDVQKRAVRAVSDITGSYSEKLELLQLPSLEDRRRRGDMLQTFKIVNQLDNVDTATYFQMEANHHNHATRQAANIEGNNLAKPNARLELRKNFFTHRVVNGWNSLSQTVKAATTLNQFKNEYYHALTQNN